ncbi:uncharacterized protein A1O9_11621 [Exophiala aquamarina CBS 119918]|uniref:USP domain-containing protein n=1 Tax=Exophiala aquamarina CBS 119918 TaxID=1182545 RepID=A0A072PA05_9EURO|nr:uncharacterized protein A1O9_11621 [Exophiala aquamarina CBS 119918]KEF52380.1 hypothetical protein A1O9_11621 [Exophiala aquamarina CBS 119918]
MAVRKRGKQPAAKPVKLPTPVQSKEPTPTARQRKTTPAASGSRAPSVPRETRAVSASRSNKANSSASLANRLLAGASGDRRNTQKQPRADNEHAHDLSSIPEEPGEEQNAHDQQNDQQISIDERLASPTNSEGPEFEDVSDVDEDDVEAARGSRVPPGFSNDRGFLCYRNSLLVVLLHSTRIVQWIKNRYLPQLVRTGLELVSYDSLVRAGDKEHPLWPDNSNVRKVSQIKYTDVLFEFKYLYHDYWAPTKSNKRQARVDAAMKRFWSYLKEVCLVYKSEEDNDSENPRSWEFKGQQDPAELLRWLIEVAQDQRRRLFAGVEAPMLPKSEQHQLDVLRSLNIENLLGFKKTVRRNCVYCNRATSAKRRSKGLERDTVWTLTVCFPTGKKGKVEPKVDLYDCMRRSLKSETSELNCGREACSEKAKADKLAVDALFQVEEEEIYKRVKTQRGQETDLQKCRERRKERLYEMHNYEGYTWNKLAKLPEVLFLSLTRFLSSVSKKEKVIVQIPEEVDLRALVEHRTPVPSETKYRLVGISNHSGDTTFSGHYIAQTLKDGRLSEFNDRIVSETDLEAVIEEQRSRKKNPFTPYLLMYEKVPFCDANNGTKDDTKDKNKEDPTNTANQEGGGGDVRVHGEMPIPVQALARAFANETATALQITKTASDPGLDQWHIAVEVAINNTRVEFPTFVIKKNANIDVRSAKIDLTLKDSQSSIRLAARREDDRVDSQNQKRATPDRDDNDNLDPPTKRRKSQESESKRSSPNTRKATPSSKPRSPKSSRKTNPGSRQGSPSTGHPMPNNSVEGLGIPKRSKSRSRSVQRLSENQLSKPEAATLGEQSLTNAQIPGLGDSGKKSSNSDGLDSLFNDPPLEPPDAEENGHADRQKEVRKMFEKGTPLEELRQKSLDPTPKVKATAQPTVGRITRAMSLTRNW